MLSFMRKCLWDRGIGPPTPHYESYHRAFCPGRDTEPAETSMNDVSKPLYTTIPVEIQRNNSKVSDL